MSRNATKRLIALATVGVIGATLAYTPVSQAFNFGEMMNPGKWMGGNDRYDDDWNGDGPYGGGPYGGGPYGYGGPGPYGAPGYGPYGAPGYGVPRYYRAPGRLPAPARSTAPSSSSQNTKSAEIESLKRRIEELEEKQQAPAAQPPSDWGSSGYPAERSDRSWGSAPAFRPMGKY